MGFCLKADGGYLQSAHEHRLRPSGATIFHYGYVKPARVLLEKMRYQAARHHGDQLSPELASKLAQEAYDFPDYDVMKRFYGLHPKVMDERVVRCQCSRRDGIVGCNRRFTGLS